jgi:hypothetical protein
MPTNNWGPWQPATGEMNTQIFLSTFGETEVQQGSPALTQAQILADESLNVSSKNLVNLGP